MKHNKPHTFHKVSHSFHKVHHAAPHVPHKSSGTHVAMAFHMKVVRKGGAMMRAQARAFAAKQRQQAARTTQLATLTAGLRKAARVVNISHSAYPDGALELWLDQNWRSQDGQCRVVFQCHTRMPHLNIPVVAFVCANNRFESVQLEGRSLTQILKQGRLFVFPATMQFSDDEQYAILETNCVNPQTGKASRPSFATVGSYQGTPFMIGPGRLGCIRQGGSSWLVGRPRYIAGDLTGYWIGKSSVCEKQKLKFIVNAPIGEPGKPVSFLVPRSARDPSCAILRCTERDDHGDPIALFHPQLSLRRPQSQGRPNAAEAVSSREPVAARAAREDGQLALDFPTNKVDSAGRPYFALIGHRHVNGPSVVTIPYELDGASHTVTLATNQKDAQGRDCFAQFANHTLPDGSPTLRLLFPLPKEPPAAAFTLVQSGRKTFLLARPNAQDASGRAMFTQAARLQDNGKWGLKGALTRNGKEGRVFIGANVHEPENDARWVRFYPNALDPQTHTPVIVKELNLLG